MNVEVTRLPESRVTLKIELTADEVDQALDRTYKQLVHRVNIPGFRKGKAPRPVVERMIGPETFLHEATDEAVRWGYRKAIDQENLTPIDQADVDTPGDAHAHVHPGEPFSFEANVAVKPEVELPDYHTIRVERPTVEVTDDEVEALLNEIRDQNATLEPVSRPAQICDVVTMNVTARVGGEDVINEENADLPLREEDEEATSVFPGISAEMVGVRPGEIREPTLTIPENYAREDLAGKTMFVRALVKEVKRKVLPEADDELAQSVSQFQTIDELIDRLRENLMAERRLEADEQLVRDAVEALTTRTFLEIPPALVEEELDRMIEDLERAFGRQQFSFEMYLQTTGQTEAQLREQMREGAIDNVKRSLVLGALADAENIDVSNKEIDRALDEMLRSMQLSEPERRRLRSSSGVRSNIRSRIRRQRAIQRLVEIVTGGEEVSAEAAEAIADATAGAADDSEETVAVEIGG
jgi:trigger factor